MTLDQACHHKDNKKMQMTAEKPKQDTNMSKKRVLGYYQGQIVQSKINSFRKLPSVQGESPATAKKLPTAVPKATKARCEPANTISAKASSTAAANRSADTKPVSTTSKNTLVRPPIRSLHSSTPSLSRPLANVTVRKGLPEKESHGAEPVVSVVKTSSSQDPKRDKAPSRSIPSKDATRTNLSNTRLIVKSKDTEQRRSTIAGVTAHRAAQLRDTTAERG